MDLVDQHEWRGGRAVYQVAGADQEVAGAAGDGCADRRVVEIELRRGEQRGVRLDRGSGGGGRGFFLAGLLLGDIVLADERVVARGLDRRVGGGGAVARHVGSRLVVRGLVWTGVDL